MEDLATLRKDRPVGPKKQRGRMHRLRPGPCGRSFWLQDQSAVLEELSVVTPRDWGRKEKQEMARLHPRPTLQSHSAASHESSPQECDRKGWKVDWSVWTYGQVR